METDIILNGFMVAEEQHGVRYINFVGDGDSSMYPTLVAGVPGWGYAIEMQECANHALKCFRGHLRRAASQRQTTIQGQNKLTTNMRLRLTRDACCAVIMRSKEDDKVKAAILLQEDILNCPMHCFGIHRKCRPEYCKVVRSKYNTTKSPTSTDSSTSTDCSIAPLQPIVPLQPIAPPQPIAPLQPIAPPQPIVPLQLIAPLQPIAQLPPIAPIQLIA